MPLRPLLLLLLCLLPWRAAQAEPLTVLLDWFLNPDHAPLIIAEQRGFFAEAGLEVEMIEPADPNDPPKLVAAGQAEIAIGYQPSLTLQVDQGLPIVRFATLVATPLNSLVVLDDGPIGHIADLKGKTVGYSIGGFEDALLGTMLETHGLTLDDVTLVNVNFALSPALLAGRVDAVIGAFRNFELNQLDIEGRPGRAFYVEDEGVPAYDELVYLTRPDLLDDPRLGRFIDATERATHLILNRPDETLAEFIAYDPNKLGDELNRRAWYDTIPRLALSPRAVDRARYAKVSRFLAARGLTSGPIPVEKLAVELAFDE